MDCGFEEPTWPVSGVKLFAFFDDVDPEGGGTLLLSGSHRLVERYAGGVPAGTAGNSRTWGQFMRQDPWLGSLYRGGDGQSSGREQLGGMHRVEGIPLEVIELAGRPGEVVIAHLHVFHSVSANASSRPRQMLSRAIFARKPD